MGYCTTKGLELTVCALPSMPSAHAYQLPAVAGVGTYAPQRSVLTSTPPVHVTGGIEPEDENPNWIGEADGDTWAFIPIAPLPCV